MQYPPYVILVTVGLMCCFSLWFLMVEGVALDVMLAEKGICFLHSGRCNVKRFFRFFDLGTFI
jgi:hypothetical protein